ncbi:MAG: tetratricopeptide repeat protein [Gemmatimonadaceae bacterium]
MTVKTTAALLSAVLVASTAGAQARPTAQGRTAAANKPASSAQKCSIQSGGSVQVSAAYDALSKFNATSSPEEQPKFLMAAVKELSAKAEKPEVEVARQWVLGQALVAWTLVDGKPTAGPRSSYGYTTQPDAPIDILLAADSAFKVVSQASPGCATQIEPMHRMSVVAATNAATAQFNAGNVDSAKVLSERLLKLEPESPHAYHLLGNIEVKQQNYQAAVGHFDKVIAATATDSSMKEVHDNAMISAAYLLQNLADADQTEAAKPLAEKAAKYFRDYIAAHPDDASARSALARTLVAAGDTVAASSMYTTLTAAPSKYSAMDLLNAGVGAANAGKPAEALKLLEAGVAGNPFFRDGLFVLGQVALQAGDLPKAADAVNRLIAVDPNNPDNFHLRAAVYQEMLATTKDKKAQKALTDSMMISNRQAGSMPVKVTVTDFAQPSDAQRILNGTIENLSDAPADYTLTVEFLDAQGKVVATKTETIAAVDAKASKTFSITIDQPGVVAYRYAPLGG